MSIKKTFGFIFYFSLTCFLFLIATGFCFASPSADALLKRKGFIWKTAVAERFRLHYEPNTFAESRIEDLKGWQEKAFIKNLRLLKIEDYPHQTDIFVVASRERMKQLVGEEINGVAFPDTKVVCFVYGERIDASGSHELMHVMARNTWGEKPKRWINEGFATYSDDIWHGYKLHDLGKFLLQKKQLVPLEKLVNDFDDYSASISYPQAGSFVKYLYERYGVDKIKAWWQQRGTTKDLERASGKTIKALEKEWHDHLMEADASKVNYNFH